MARSSTQSWKVIQEIIKDRLEQPSTTSEIAAWVESPIALAFGIDISRSTVFRLLKDKTTAGIYGLSAVGKDERWVYSDKTIEKTKKEFSKAASVIDSRIIEAEANKEAAQTVALTKALSESSIEDLITRLDELQVQQRAYAKDDIEQRVLLGFRAARERYGNEENLTNVFGTTDHKVEYVTMAHDAFKEREDYEEVMLMTMAAIIAVVGEKSE